MQNMVDKEQAPRHGIDPERIKAMPRNHAMPRLILIALIAATVGAAPAVGQEFLDKAREAVRDAGKKIEDAAKETGRSVRDFLTDNPDLNRDIVDFGKTLGLPGFEEAPPASGPGVALSVAEGPPGSEVTLQASGLPGNADIAVSAGPKPADMRPLAKAKTNERGEAFATVKVPPKPEDGDTLVFAIETADGRVRLVSGPFKIAAAGPPLVVTGTLSKEGVECPTLRGDDGKLYSLTPRELGAFGPGDRVTVEGTLAGASICMQGATIAVTKISAAK